MTEVSGSEGSYRCPTGDSVQVVESVGRRYAVLLSHPDERQRRLMLASEAAELGRGGIRTVTEASSLVLLGVGSDRQSVCETARSERDEPAGLGTVPPDDDVIVLVPARACGTN